MPEKYHIDTRNTPPLHKMVGKYGIIDWNEDCSHCQTCVKDKCVYLLYEEEEKRLKEVEEFIDYLYDCEGCLQCIQNCTKGLLSRAVNPEFERLGNDYWTPDIILTTWYQAETGRIPVSGAGYDGPFVGEGFDSMWTDMSEIVRPTRDGIHGREYISTVVDIGGKKEHLEFNDNKNISSGEIETISIPAPIILQYSPWHKKYESIFEIIANSARRTSLLLVIPVDEITENLHPYLANIIPQFHSTDINVRDYDEILLTTPAVGLTTTDIDTLEEILNLNPDIIPIIKFPLTGGCVDTIKELIPMGIKTFHLDTDWYGMEVSKENPRFIVDLIRDVHSQLIEEGLRDQITLIGSGGIAMAEHLAKAIICGFDLVAIDLPIFIALECRLCERCRQSRPCPISLDDTELEYGTQRVVNLVASWHNQLLEVMGAMGIREVRRLRGETGRAMFYDELCERVFDPIFGSS